MTLLTALKEKNIEQIRKIASKLPMADLADLLESFAPQERVLFFRLLKTEMQSDIFAKLEHKYQEQLIRSFTDKQIDEIVGDLYAYEIADLIEEVPVELQKRIIISIHDKETREKVNKILKFSDDQTGSVMNVDLVLLDENMTIAQALNKIKKAKNDVELAQFFFVVDKFQKLIGYIPLEDLVFSQSSDKIKQFVKPSGSVFTTTNKEEAANEFAKYDMSVLPVINLSKQVVGMITAADVIDIVSEAATEDAHLSAGISSIILEKQYSEISIWKLFKSRILWLMLLMISATISQIVLDNFMDLAGQKLKEHHIALQSSVIWSTAIVAILPVISGAAGNAGSQSSTMIIRALATGDITVKDYFKVFRKELTTSVIIGSALAIANFVRLLIYYSVTGELTGEFYEKFIFLSLAASLALFVVIGLANIVGGTLPLLAKKMKLDPAVMAAPLLTTIIDALSTMIFFGISIGILLITF